MTAKDSKSGSFTYSIACKRTKNGLTFAVRVQPRASRLSVEGVEDGTLKVKLTAPPADGEANAQLLKLLAKTFRIRKTAMRIIKGETSRDKVVEIVGPVPENFEALT